MKESTYDYNRRRRKKHKNRAFEVLTAIAAIVTICCAYAGNVNPVKFFAAPFMTLAFIPMLIAIILLLVFALVWRRWIAVLTVVAAMLISLPIIHMYIPLNNSENAPPVPADTSLMLKVMTYNVLGFNYSDPVLHTEPSKSLRLILDAKPDVVLMQEGGSGGREWSIIPSIKPYLADIQIKYPYCYQSAEGLSIMSKYPFTTGTIGEPQQARSPLGYNRDQTSYIARYYDLQLPSGKQLRLVDFRLQSYHLSFGKSQYVRVSPDAKPSALERMRRSFALRGDNASTLREGIDKSPDNVIVCGDMNDVPSSHVYRIIRGKDLHDAWLEVGNGYGHTFNLHHLYYRIDHILYRGELRALEAKRLKGGSSDHYPLMVTFDLDITKNDINQSLNN